MNDISKPNVLFLCTGNSARSQIAEGLLRARAGDRYTVYSAGLEPKGVNPYAIKAMDEIGIDISNQESTDLSDYMGYMNFATLVTVCDHAEKNCPRAFLMAINNHLHWSIEDPAAFEGGDEETAEKFREVREQLDQRIQAWLAEQEAG